MQDIELGMQSLSLVPAADARREQQPILMPHQIKAHEFIRKRESGSDRVNLVLGGFLGMQMGMGKTLTMLSHIHHTTSQSSSSLMAQPPAQGLSPTLVVCPKTAMLTWKQEIAKHYPGHFRVLIFRKDETNVEDLSLELIKEYDIVITNYDYVRSLAKKFDLFELLAVKDARDRLIGANVASRPLSNATSGEAILFSLRWGRIIADESHNFSNYKTACWQSMMCLCGTYRWCLTGTPIRNVCDDLYAQYKFLGYRDPKFDIKEFRKLKLDSVLYYLNYEKANITLPEINHYRVPVYLKGNNKNIYDYYLDKANEAYESFTIGTKSFVEVLSLFIRLRQICVAPWTVTPRIDHFTTEQKDAYELSQLELDEVSEGLATWINDKHGTAGFLSPKIVKTMQIINSIPKGEKIIVFTMFKRVIEVLEWVCNEKSFVSIHGDVTGQKRTNILNSFKKEHADPNDNIDVLFISYKIGAESLNLTEATHVILLEPWWCPAVIDQAKSRVHRLGQTKSTNIYELYVKSTKDLASMEEAIIEYCDAKREKAKLYYDEGKMDPDFKMNARTLGMILSRTTCRIPSRQS